MTRVANPPAPPIERKPAPPPGPPPAPGDRHYNWCKSQRDPKGRCNCKREEQRARVIGAVTAAVLKSYREQRDPIPDSDLDDEQPVSLHVRFDLGTLRKLDMEARV